jgi:ABC-type thiamin/hydroxymethylpyrimidine transport system permease subunit
MTARPRYYLTTKDLVTIALLSALGGVLSTYIGYLGNLINHMLGVPFGAGQFLAGMHVLWIVLAVGITRKKGVGTATGTVKGIVELFMGSTHGIVIVFVSIVQGLIVDLFLFSDKAKAGRNPISYGIAGAVASASNVVVFQAFFFSGVPLLLIAMLCMLAGASGMIFCGWLAGEMLSSIEHAGLIESKPERPVIVPGAHYLETKRSRVSLASLVAVFVFLGIFTVGSVYYFYAIYHLPGAASLEVTGQVNEPFKFVYSDFKDQEVTINAELTGSVTHVGPRNYTGIPLRSLIDQAAPKDGAQEVLVIGSDGYTAEFPLANALSDSKLIITEGTIGYRIVAANYDGAYWVEDVVTIEVR